MLWRKKVAGTLCPRGHACWRANPHEMTSIPRKSSWQRQAFGDNRGSGAEVIRERDMQARQTIEREHAERVIADLFGAADETFVIHYALQQQLRRHHNEQAPPVAAIALSNLASTETVVFSIKAEADRAGIDLGQVPGQAPTPEQMARLEYSLLFNYNEFLARHPTHRFLHWYMRDEAFGFAALEHRFQKVLADVAQSLYGVRSAAPAMAFGFGGPTPFPVRIEDARRIDLARIIRDITGTGPIGLREIADLNGLSHTELIPGEQEPGAFESGNHARLQWSTSTKTRLICQIARLVQERRLVLTRPARQRAPGEGRIFINYRREDSEAAAGRLHDRLAQVFGEDNVFFDTDDLPAGIDFVKVLRQQLEACDVFLAVIGRRWATIEDDHGRLRLHDQDDFVRAEIGAALAREIPVIPVLVDGAPLPGRHQLPADIVALVNRQKVDLRNSQFAGDAERLIGEIRRALRFTSAQAGRGPGVKHTP